MKVVNTEKEAKKMFEVFHDRDSKRKVPMNFSWPTQVQEIGQAKAQMYRSNKWKSNLKDFEDYKHIAEGFQFCYAVPGFLRDFATDETLKVYGPKRTLEGPMPQHFTILAPLIGVQVCLYDKSLKLKEDNLYEVVVARGMLGGARHPKTNEPFLFVYTKAEGIGLLITGDELDIEKDGIVG